VAEIAKTKSTIDKKGSRIITQQLGRYNVLKTVTKQNGTNINIILLSAEGEKYLKSVKAVENMDYGLVTKFSRH